MGNGNRSLRALCKKADVKPCGFRHLRHTYATLMARNGAPLHTIKELMGHGSLNTTQIYCHSSPSDAVAAVASVLG